MSRYWISWNQPTEDCRPLTYPPNPAILGWWCSGYAANGMAQICAVVSADDDDHAATCVMQDWPEAIGWRFINKKPDDFIPGDRFPVSDWMVERLSTKGPTP